MNFHKKEIAFVLFLIMILLISGCISSPKDKTVTTKFSDNITVELSTPDTITTASRVLPENYINISPIEDFQTDSFNNITGTTIRNITGFTNIPNGTRLEVFVYNKDIHLLVKDTQGRSVHAWIPVLKTENSSQNFFSYQCDMKGQPAGHYQVKITSGGTNAVANFVIISHGPWIWINTSPVQNFSFGQPFTISGTANLPPGSEISVIPWRELHPCPPDKPLIAWGHQLCNRNCEHSPKSGTTKVILGTNGTNIWAYTFNTDMWCEDVHYGMTATVNNWKNVTRPFVTFRNT